VKCDEAVKAVVHRAIPETGIMPHVADVWAFLTQQYEVITRLQKSVVTPSISVLLVLFSRMSFPPPVTEHCQPAIAYGREP
jgi:hypothetical protein